MKKARLVVDGILFVSLCASLLAGCAARAPISQAPPAPVNQDWTVTAKWNFDFTNYLVCSSSVTKGCVNGFTWGYLDGANQVPLKTLPVTSGSGVQNFTDTTNAQLPIGSLTGYVVANYVDAAGAALKSAAGIAAQPTPVPAGVPGNVAVTIQ